MSWLRTLAGPLQSPSAGDGGSEEFSHESSDATPSFDDARKDELEGPIEQGSPSRRAQEDISTFTRALSSKFWGVSSFLSPPPFSQTTSSSSSPPRIYSSSSPSLRRQQQEPTISSDSELVVSYESSRTAGFRSDFEEIGGTLKTGIARLSNNVTINGISKIAYSFLSVREEEEDEVEAREHEDEHVVDVVGVTDEVLAFARNIACHPETWLDFPMLSDDEDFFDDCDMSIIQQDHALVIESLAPRLAALRIELCPTHMSIGCFWKIYFALLHPRLNKHDADLLSTPQIVEARAMLQHGLQKQAREAAEQSRGCNLALRDADDECSAASADQFYAPGMLTNYWLPQGGTATFSSSSVKDLETEKHSALNSGTEFVDKFVVKEEALWMNVKEEEDDWPEDDTQDVDGAGMAGILRCNAEDISFSDLEDGDDNWNPAGAIKGLKLI
ncbi:hypothetical protein KSP39_PZI004943 [Platanthera zijinensis]|uniref:BSD domain-containing protein n=1 Tax=Platanthera zijinensis TaxID=2320716 RepID=A0AAP0BSI7_9ASPA